MATNIVGEAGVFTWTNGTGSAVVSGEIVPVGEILAVALDDIADTATGTLRILCEVTAPKVSAAVIAMGESLTWDVSAGEFDDNAATPAAGDVTGPPAFAAEAAGNGVTTIKVWLTGVPGTVT